MQNREKRIWNGKTTIVLVTLMFVVAAGLLGLFLFGRMSAESKKFEFGNGNGYIISSVLTEDGVSSTRQYFDANTSYKAIRSEEIEFDNTSGEMAQVPTDSFVHYADGSIGFLKKAALLDFSKLKDTKDQVVTYYGLMPSSTLKYTTAGYVADLQGEKQTFESILAKISESRFLVAAPEITVKVGEVTKSIKNGYLEITYFDGDIIRVENQELTYQSIADDMEITVGDTRVDLRSRHIYKSGVAVLDMGLITIESDDNIVLSEYEEEEEGEGGEGENGEGGDEIDEKERQWNDVLKDLANGIIENTTEPDEINEYDRTADPVFTITSMDVTANSFDATVEIEDKDGLLTGDTKIEVVDISSGNAVYQNRLTDGETFFDVSTENLSPETDYAFVVTANYIKDNVEVARTFIQRTFVTESIGVSVEENYVTTYSINATVKRSVYSRVRELTAILLNPAGETVGSRIVNFEDEGDEVILNYSTDLEPNTAYTLLLKDFHYKNMIVTNGFSISKNFTTLKRKPTLGKPSFTVDKREALFNINVGDIIDLDNGIVTYRYEVYDARTITVDQETNQLVTGTPVYVVDKSVRSGAEIPVDGGAIKRETPYVFRMVALFNDNKFEHEYTTAVSNIMKLDGKEFPSLIFIEDEVTFETIDGRIQIIDDGGVLDNTKQIIVSYKNSVGEGDVYPTTVGADLVVPFYLEGVRKNESYVVSLYGTVDLKDADNDPIDNCYLGSVIIHTKATNPFALNYAVNSSDTKSAFSVLARLTNGGEGDTELEADTLSGITFNIYEGNGTSGNLLRSVNKIDGNLEEKYVSTLRTEYYDNEFMITPSTFGLRNKDFSSGTYTIEITNAHDYTVYPNEIPIKNNVFTVEAKGSIPDVPADVDDAIEIIPIRNGNMPEESIRSDLDEDTIVGYSLLAEYDNSGRVLKEIYYALHAADGTVIATYTYVLPAGQVNVEPIKVYFDGDGTSGIDSDFRRGNTYYVTYTAGLDTVDSDGIIDEVWPSDGTVLKSKNFTPPKQEPDFIAFPVNSDASTFSWKYTFKDIDHAATTNLNYAIDEMSIGTIPLTVSDEFQDMKFRNLTTGDLKASYRYKLERTANETIANVINYKFDGYFTPTTPNFDVTINNNRAVFTFENFEMNTLFDRVTAIKLEIRDSSDVNILKTFENLRFNDDGTIKINLSEIADYVGQTLVPHVYLYYDSGVEGFMLTGDRFALEHKSGIRYEYYSLSGDRLSSNVTAFGSDLRYAFDLPNQRIDLNSYTGSDALSIAVEPSAGGIIYNGSPIMFKEIRMVDASSSSFSFDTVVPGVSVKEISADLMKVNIRAEVSGLSNDSIKDNKLYLKVYRSDSTWVESELIIDNMETILNGNVMQTEITGLEMGTYYFFRIFADVKTTDGYVRMQLFDLDDPNNADKTYRFVTLSQVEVEDITVEYDANSQADRFLKVTYGFDHVVSVDGIRYEVWEVNNDGSKVAQINLDISVDTDIRKNMTKKIPIPSGCGVITNKYYKVFVIPYTMSGSERADISESGSDVFFFDQLISPFIGISSTLDLYDNNKVIFKVLTRDRKKSVVDGVYTIEIIDGNGNNVTPNAYVGQEYEMGGTKYFELADVGSYEEYTFMVNYVLDTTNEGVSKYRSATRTYKIRTTDVDPYIGTISAVADINDTSRIRLVFNNSTKISEIKRIQYLVESPTGQSWDHRVDFVPRQVVSQNNGTYYYFILPYVSLTDAGTHYIQLQFLDNSGNVLTTSSVEYLYMKDS